MDVPDVSLCTTRATFWQSACYHEHQVPNPDSNLDHNLHGRGGLSLDLNPVCLRVRVNATSLDQDLDLNARVNGAIDLTPHTCLIQLTRAWALRHAPQNFFSL